MKLSTHNHGICFLLLLNTIAAASTIPQIVLEDHKRGSSGAVACEAKECSAIGRDLLARGGNAVDAIVGTTFCVGVVGMYHSGIGGGGFALIRDKDGSYEAVDFRESATASASEDMYDGDKQPSISGGLAVAVPSEVYGLEYIHKKYGTLPWKTVMAGAINVARNGFKVSMDLVVKMNDQFASNKTFLVDHPAWAQDFAPNGTLVKEGEIMTRKRYADTLQKVSEQGAKALYTGKIAASLLKTINEANGSMTLQDLQNYRMKFPKVQHSTFRGLDIYGMSAPAGGTVAMHILKIMERFKPNAWFTDLNLTYHRFVEAMRFGYSARRSLGDPEFVDVLDVHHFEHQMLNASTIDKVSQRLTDKTSHPPTYYNPDKVWLPESHGTSHLSAADASGMAVSLTTTINLIFGALIMDPESGIILNDEMNDFSIPGVDNEFDLKPSVPNFIRPHKRPLSSMTPLIATYPNGTLYAVVGASGGSRIISATAQVLWHIVDHGMTLQEAMRYPRLHDQLYPNRVTLENGFPDSEEAAEYLKKLGHNVKFVNLGQSSVQGIKVLSDGSFEAVGEPRQNNSAGYTI